VWKKIHCWKAIFTFSVLDTITAFHNCQVNNSRALDVLSSNNDTHMDYMHIHLLKTLENKVTSGSVGPDSDIILTAWTGANSQHLWLFWPCQSRLVPLSILVHSKKIRAHTFLYIPAPNLFFFLLYRDEVPQGFEKVVNKYGEFKHMAMRWLGHSTLWKDGRNMHL